MKTDPPPRAWSPMVDAGTREPRLLDRVRLAIRSRHYSLRTEEAYVAWARRFVVFHGKRHPQAMGETEINAFLADLAVRAGVSASTQNQALAALLFLYRHVLEKPLPAFADVVRAKRPRRLPVVMTRAEVRALIGRLGGSPRLV
ncbi:MAG TPA: phage integrase N-terminal SAM-like domain-containing protein, partial [Thermoanaerobaculia bacterium]